MTQRKIWNRLGEALVIGTALGASATVAAAPLPQALAAALATQGDTAESGNAGVDPHAGHGAHAMAAGEGEGGEGEGEGEGAASPAEDDVAYLGRLGLVRGHLLVGVALYEAGEYEMALSHMKHPGDELYRGIKPAMDARGASDFAPALSALANAVESKRPLPEVKSAHEALETAIIETQTVVDTAADTAVATVLGAVHALVREAAAEYSLAVKDGQLVNAHEYQDSYGFTRIARSWIDTLTPRQRAAAPEAVEEVTAELDKLLATVWPSVVPAEQLDTDPSELYGAAARIELATLSVK